MTMIEILICSRNYFRIFTQ